MDIVNLLNIHQVRWDYQLSNISAIKTFVTLDFLKLLKFGWSKFGEFMVVRQIRQRFPHQSFPLYGIAILSNTIIVLYGKCTLRYYRKSDNGNISCYKYGLYFGSVLVMQLCSLAIATQVCNCYTNNQLLQKKNVSAKHPNISNYGSID